MRKILVSSFVCVLGVVGTVFANGEAKEILPLPKGTKIIQVGATEQIKTLEGALEKVKEIRKTDAKSPLALCVAPGEYAPPNQLLFTKEIASTNFGRLFIYAKDFANKPRIHGGMPITGWQKVKFNGRDDVWCADVSKIDIPKRPRILFANGTRMQPARWPNLNPKQPFKTGFAHAIGATKEFPDAKFFANQLLMRPKDLRKWAHPEDGWSTYIPEHNYWVCFNDLKAQTNNVIYLDTNQRHALGGYQRYDRYYVENMAEELDDPNEWYYNSREKKVYFLPADGADPNKTVVAFAKEKSMMVFPKETGNCTLAGLELTSGYEGIRIVDGKFIDIVGCSIHDLGFQGRGGCNESNGIFIMSDNVTVRDCDIYNIGAWGVFVHSYGPCKVDYRSNVIIENNYIHHCGDVDPGAGGIRNAGQGVLVKNNLLHDFARSAICGYGRMSEISYNRVRHTNMGGEDTGALYDAAWTSCVGTKICYNWISDSIGYRRVGECKYQHGDMACGIYMDECSGGLEIYGNLIERSHWAAMHLHNGRWSTISNNIFVSNGSRPLTLYTHQFSMQSWDRKGFQGGRRSMYANEHKRFVQNDPRWKQFPALAQDPWTDEVFSNDEKGTMIMGINLVNNIFYFPDQNWSGGTMSTFTLLNASTNTINRNLYWNNPHANSSWHTYHKGYSGINWNQWREHGFDKDSLIADPLFVDARKKDYRLRPESPAHKLGFKDLPLDKVGLYITPFRPAMPKEAEGMREHPEWF